MTETAYYNITEAARMAKAVKESAEDAGEEFFAAAASRFLKYTNSVNCRMPEDHPDWNFVLEAYNEVIDQ